MKLKEYYLKHKTIYNITIIFFLLVNTSYLWTRYLGIYSVIEFFVSILFSLALLIVLLYQVIKSILQVFRQKSRLYLISFMTFVIITSFFFPSGLLNYGILEGECLLEARKTGAVGCATTLKLYSNNRFIERDICFIENLTKGDFRKKGDTIYFDNSIPKINIGEDFEYGIIIRKYSKNRYYEYIKLYKDNTDTTGMELFVRKNNLFK